MRSRSKSAPYAELLIVMGVLLPISACTWANPWQKTAAAPSEGESAEVKKEMPKVKLSRDEQMIYDRYHPNTGDGTGLSPESRSVESRLGYR